MSIPKSYDLYNQVLRAIRNLGGSASISELDEEVIKSLKLTDKEIAKPHDERRTELEYQLAWARTYLKAYGLLDNSERGVWVLTAKGKENQAVNSKEVRRFVNSKKKERRQNQPEKGDELATKVTTPEFAEEVLEQSWREELLKVLLNLPSDSFERLCQRLLRESGFVQVEVTGRSGDGGIDGVGIVRLAGLLSFPILFQCKRYKGSVSPSTIRDFRGAMVGRADRGLVITTGKFSRDAKLEATRDGAPPIDLVDGEQLLDKLKDLQLGIVVEMIEKVSVDAQWFDGI